ncbi:MAG: hypothetical protein IJS32_09250 [Kiritimatiellae bacterium]|nr:hypothetical protein [Kiritimatiellia bacterium]
MNDARTPRLEQLPGLDILKFAMAMLIVAIHAELFKEIGWLYDFVSPLKFSAVPGFFVVSSFLFFRRRETNAKALGHYVKRLALFYAFWFVMLLPVTIGLRKWHAHFDCLVFLEKLFLASTFRGSWFIMALMIGVPVVWLARKMVHPLVLLFVAFAIHLPFQYPDWWPDIVRYRFSFLPPLLWIAIGALLASPSICTAPSKGLPPAVLLPVLYGGMLFRNLEPLVKPAFVVALFLVFLNCNIKPRPVFLTLRKMGILVFVTHFAFSSFVNHLALRRSPVWDNSFLHFSVVLGCAALVSRAILALRTKRFFGWLEYGL